MPGMSPGRLPPQMREAFKEPLAPPSTHPACSSTPLLAHPLPSLGVPGQDCIPANSTRQTVLPGQEARSLPLPALRTSVGGGPWARSVGKEGEEGWPWFPSNSLKQLEVPFPGAGHCPRCSPPWLEHFPYKSSGTTGPGCGVLS